MAECHEHSVQSGINRQYGRYQPAIPLFIPLRRTSEKIGSSLVKGISGRLGSFFNRISLEIWGTVSKYVMPVRSEGIETMVRCAGGITRVARSADCWKRSISGSASPAGRPSYVRYGSHSSKITQTTRGAPGGCGSAGCSG